MNGVLGLLASTFIVLPFLYFGFVLIGFGALAFVLARAGSERNARRDAWTWIWGLAALLVSAASAFLIVAWFREPHGETFALIALATAFTSLLCGLLVLFTRTIWSFISPAERTEEATAHRRLLWLQTYVGGLCFVLGVTSVVCFVVLRSAL